MYNLAGNGIDLEEGDQPTSVHIWNNTVEGGLGGTQDCIRQGHAGTDTIVVIENNLCVSSIGDRSGVSSSIAASSLSVDHNVLLSPSRAASDGYASPSAQFAWLPPAGAAPTAGTGVNLTSVCTALLPALCVDTSYAGARAPSSRPAVGAWAMGAYQQPWGSALRSGHLRPGTVRRIAFSPRAWRATRSVGRPPDLEPYSWRQTRAGKDPGRAERLFFDSTSCAPGWPMVTSAGSTKATRATQLGSTSHGTWRKGHGCV